MARPPTPIIRQMGDALVTSMPLMLRGAIRQTTAELPSMVRAMGKAMDLNKMPRERMRRTNIEIAEQARKKVAAGWYSRLPRKSPQRTKATESRQHGALGRALADPMMTLYTSDRVISFVNTDVLDAEASHWYRVNYGAVGSRYGEGPQPRTFVVRLNGQTVGQFRDDSPPDPTSWIPRVRYWSGGQLYPKSTDVVASPFGARAARFLDIGQQVIAKEAPRAYTELFGKYLREANGANRNRLAHKHDIVVEGDMRYQRTSWSFRTRT